MLCDGDKKDSIITKEFTFATAFETMVPQGINVFVANMDEQGLVPESMKDILHLAVRHLQSDTHTDCNNSYGLNSTTPNIPISKPAVFSNMCDIPTRHM